jgi:hypothetical protein
MLASDVKRKQTTWSIGSSWKEIICLRRELHTEGERLNERNDL